MSVLKIQGCFKTSLEFNAGIETPA